MINILKKLLPENGDTIVEVLLAITVAAFALGTSYSISNKSLQRSISARERNEATNILQSQIAALKQREQVTTNVAAFNSYFAVNSTSPSNFKHFCLDESATGTGSTNWFTTNTSNVGMVDASTPLQTTGSPSYNPNFCVKHNVSTDFYIDIVALATAKSLSSTTPTVYQINVRWAAVGNGATNQASVYYRF